jgi:hypothetical protein
VTVGIVVVIVALLFGHQHETQEHEVAP